MHNKLFSTRLGPTSHYIVGRVRFLINSNSCFSACNWPRSSSCWDWPLLCIARTCADTSPIIAACWELMSFCGQGSKLLQRFRCVDTSVVPAALSCGSGEGATPNITVTPTTTNSNSAARSVHRERGGIVTSETPPHEIVVFIHG